LAMFRTKWDMPMIESWIWLNERHARAFHFGGICDNSLECGDLSPLWD